MLDPRLEISLNRAVEFASEKGHEFVSLEHILLTLLTDNEEAKEILLSCAVDLKSLKKELSSYLKDHVPTIPKKEREEDHQWKPH